MRKTISAFLFFVLLMTLAGCSTGLKKGPATALHNATNFGVPRFVEETLQANPKNINSRNENGMTPLFIACQGKNYEVVEILLKHGADPSIPADSPYDNLAVVDSFNFEVYDLTDRGELFEKFLVRNYLRYPIGLAMANNDKKTLSLLVQYWESNADKDRKDEYHPFHWCVESFDGLSNLYKHKPRKDFAKVIVEASLINEASKKMFLTRSQYGFHNGYNVLKYYEEDEFIAFTAFLKTFGYDLSEVYSLSEYRKKSYELAVEREQEEAKESRRTVASTYDSKVAESVAMNFWREYYHTIHPMPKKDSRYRVHCKVVGASTKRSTNSYAWVMVYFQLMDRISGKWTDTMEYPITVDRRSGSKGNCYPGHQSIQ